MAVLARAAVCIYCSQHICRIKVTKGGPRQTLASATAIKALWQNLPIPHTHPNPNDAQNADAAYISMATKNGAKQAQHEMNQELNDVVQKTIKLTDIYVKGQTKRLSERLPPPLMLGVGCLGRAVRLCVFGCMRIVRVYARALERIIVHTVMQ